MSALLGTFALLAGFLAACGSGSQQPSSGSSDIHTPAEVRAAFEDSDIQLSEPVRLDEEQAVFITGGKEPETWFIIEVLRDSDAVSNKAVVFDEGKKAGLDPFIHQSFVAYDNIAVTYEQSTSTDKVERLLEILESLD